jgi:hypothetical protein
MDPACAAPARQVDVVGRFSSWAAAHGPFTGKVWCMSAYMSRCCCVAAVMPCRWHTQPCSTHMRPHTQPCSTHMRTHTQPCSTLVRPHTQPCSTHMRTHTQPCSTHMRTHTQPCSTHMRTHTPAGHSTASHCGGKWRGSPSAGCWQLCRGDAPAGNPALSEGGWLAVQHSACGSDHARSGWPAASNTAHFTKPPVQHTIQPVTS